MTHISFTNQYPASGDILIVPVFDNRVRGESATLIDARLGGAVAHAIDTDIHFKGNEGQTLTVPAPQGSHYKKMILIGMGAPDGMNTLRAETIGGKLSGAIAATGMSTVTILADDFTGATAHLAADMANGFVLKSYTFDRYKTDAPKTDTTVHMVQTNPDPARERFGQLAPVTAGVFFARDLSNEPPNVLYPKTMAKRVEDALSAMGVYIHVIGKHGLGALNMRAHLAVGQGSPNDPQLVLIEYKGPGSARRKPLALVGKGLTFDTGGVSLKSNMENMKFDMSGAATVAGTIMALAGRKAPVHVVGVLGLAENNIGSNAYKVDDIITMKNGKTVEIKNTDAEGRLVLADCLTYVQTRTHKPHTIIDVATLTGACKSALGSTMCGVFANDDKLAERIRASGKKVGENGHTLPLGPEFSKAVRGTYADLQNLGAPGTPGASTAAAFLQEFIEGKTKWAHLDIAGVANGVTGHATLPDKIGTGFGVRLLNQLILDHFEKPVRAKPAPKPQP